MATTFDATLKDMGRDSPEGFLAAFDRPAAGPVKPLNVDLSTVTRVADLILGLGDPLEEIIHLDFQASAAAWKHADLMVYNVWVYAHYHVPVHTVILLLRPGAAHANMDGVIQYAPRPESGGMSFRYQIIRLWERPTAELLAADLGVAPLAVLGRLPADVSLEEGLSQVVRQLAERLQREVPADRAKRLLTDALLLTGLRVRRDVAARIFGGVRVMQESDTYLMIVDEGRIDHAKKAVLIVGEKRLGPPGESVKTSLDGITDLERLDRMLSEAVIASTWDEILDTP